MGANIAGNGLKHYPKRYPDIMDYREDGAKPLFLRQGTTDETVRAPSRRGIE